MARLEQATAAPGPDHEHSKAYVRLRSFNENFGIVFRHRAHTGFRSQSATPGAAFLSDCEGLRRTAGSSSCMFGPYRMWRECEVAAQTTYYVVLE